MGTAASVVSRKFTCEIKQFPTHDTSLPAGVAAMGMQPQYLLGHGAELPTRTQLLGDRCCLRRLLGQFASQVDAALRRDLLRLAIDLFDVYTQLTAALPDARQADAQHPLFDLIETAEVTDPASRLYWVRGLELKQRLELYLDAEETRSRPSRPVWRAIDPEVLHLRQVLLERAQAALARTGEVRQLAA